MQQIFNENEKNEFKKILFPNPITNKTMSIKIRRDLIEKADKFPISITKIHENVPLTIYIDAKFKVRGVEQSIFIDEVEKELSANNGEHLLNKAIKGKKFGNVFVLGLPYSGKKSIVKRLSQHYFSKKISQNLGTHIMQSVIENTGFFFYDMHEKNGTNEKWTPNIVAPDAIIFVIDVTNKSEELEETKKRFDQMVKKYYLNNEDEAKSIPLLILGNKIDFFVKQKVSIDSLMKGVFNIVEPDRFENIDYHVGLVSALSGQGVINNFKWLIAEKIILSL